MKKLLTLLLGYAAMLAQAQTPNTNDVARAVNPGTFYYSTNQNAGLIWVYRNVTNTIPITVTNLVGADLVVTTNTLPTFAEWHAGLIKGVAGAIANDYARQRAEAEQAIKGFQDLRERWADLTPAQRQAVLTAAGL